MRELSVIQADIDAKNKAIDQEVANGPQANNNQINLWRMDLVPLHAELEAAKVQEEAHGARVEQSRTAALSAIETLTYNGVTLRQLCESDTGYDMAVKMMDMLTTAQAEQSSKLIQGYEERELQLQRQLDIVNGHCAEGERKNTSLVELANSRKLEKEDAESKRDAAVQQLEEAQQEIKRLEAKVQEQRDELAVGVRGAISVVDTEQQKAEMEALAEKIKADKTIYDLVPDQTINPKNYTAKLASNGETITFNWTQKNSFIIIVDPNEVEQFRTKYAEKYNLSDIPLDGGNVEDEVKKPVEIPFPTADGALQLGNSTSEKGGESETQAAPVTEARFAALQERVTRLEVILDERAVA